MSIFLRLLTFTGLPCLGRNDEQSGPKLRMLAASCHVGYFCPTGPRAEKSLWNTWMSLEDVTKMRALFSEEFFQRFHMAYRNYEDRFVPIESFCIVSSRFTGTWKMHTFSDLSTFCRLVNGWLQGICSLAAQAPAWFKWVEGSTLGFQSTCPHPDLHRKQIIFSN